MTRDDGKVEATCVVCGKAERQNPWQAKGFACSKCWPKVSTQFNGQPHCKFPVPYTSCNRTDINERGHCPKHADTECVVCSAPAMQVCETGTFGICGAATCSMKCHKKHYKRDHPDGRLM